VPQDGVNAEVSFWVLLVLEWLGRARDWADVCVRVARESKRVGRGGGEGG
jgi:hypothetical protein